MDSHLSIAFLVSEATLPVQIILGILLLASLLSWTIILQRLMIYQALMREDHEFEASFWSGGDLLSLHEDISNDQDATGLAYLFHSGLGEYIRLRTRMDGAADLVLDSVRHSMRVAANRERERMEEYLSVLATIASTAPYIGLLGTVWGVIDAFSALTGTEQTTLATVAPGIIEALVATAMGLFVAIPAVAAYNYFVNQADIMHTAHNNFIDELTTYLYRQGASDSGEGLNPSRKLGS